MGAFYVLKDLLEILLRTDSMFNTRSAQTLLTNPSKLKIYLCKIPTLWSQKP